MRFRNSSGQRIRLEDGGPRMNDEECCCGLTECSEVTYGYTSVVVDVAGYTGTPGVTFLNADTYIANVTADPGGCLSSCLGLGGSPFGRRYLDSDILSLPHIGRFGGNFLCGLEVTVNCAVGGITYALRFGNTGSPGCVFDHSAFLPFPLTLAEIFGTIVLTGSGSLSGSSITLSGWS